MEYQPKTGAKCFCKRGVQRDNCPHCEGTGMRIDFKAIRARAALPRCPNCSGETESAGAPGKFNCFFCDHVFTTVQS